MSTPEAKYRNHYTPYPYSLTHTKLNFEIFESNTIVKSTLEFERNTDHPQPLLLDGENLTLVEIKIDGTPTTDYALDKNCLTLLNCPERFTLEITTDINPAENKTLAGLYKSGDMFCTQCEAHGFRRMTYYPDRPDVLSRFETTIIADKEKYPVLLSNGNCIKTASLDDGRHMAVWDDPHLKPCYLFALVAGDLAVTKGSFTTQSGRDVSLEVYAFESDIEKCDYAIQALIDSMIWDEKCYGREYDLDRYMIVATPDFNMGAMENKGLNVFNTKYVLANPRTATDKDYVNVQAVIAHEYFHNWTGNRVTCRDWFQLSLKEGLTVFRDQSFTADHHDATVKRIEDVKIIKTAQFSEDASPMAHPIRPDSYIEMNNFYTVTVYNKGAEVIRMMHTLLGAEHFRKGMDIYFERHDGQAVTCNDFVSALEAGGNIDLTQFKHWYSQAGTPVVKVRSEYNADARSFTLYFEQSCPATPGQDIKKPFHIPISLGLISPDGKSCTLNTTTSLRHGHCFELKDTADSITFTDLDSAPIPSVLRDFSAPVRLDIDYSHADLLHLYHFDDNPFNRWQAGQSVAQNIIFNMMDNDIAVPDDYINAVGAALDANLQPAMIAELLALPCERTLSEALQIIRPDDLHDARERVLNTLAQQHYDRFLAKYKALHTTAPYEFTLEACQNRTLKNTLLQYLARLESSAELCQAQFDGADNMTDQIAALGALMKHPNTSLAEEALDRFFDQWQHEALVVDKWLSLQATSDREDTLAKVKMLTQHAAYESTNPNKVYALIGGFSANPVRFHDASGQGYAFLADQVLALDKHNPQVSARMVRALMTWRRYDAGRQAHIAQHLERIQAASPSRDVYEIVSKSLQQE